jgi:septal ring factor EnvC (AmiA/AmiB activator)
MKFPVIKNFLALYLIASTWPLISFADSLNLKQFQVDEATKEFNYAKQEYDDLSDKIKMYEKTIAQQTEQLNLIKNQRVASDVRLKKAKESLRDRTKEFNKAWDNHKSVEQKTIN